MSGQSTPPSPPAQEIVIADDLPALVRLVVPRVAAAARTAIAARGRFRFALAGGSTPRALYPALAPAVDWARTDVFFGDERAVPPDDPASNYRMARETLLDPARVPPANVFRWRAEDPDLAAAARDYERALTAPAEPPWLDLALLGLGPDGHTASLFPGTSALAEESRLAVAVDVPVDLPPNPQKGSEPPSPTRGTRRLTLTYPALLDAWQLFFLVAGPDKAAALAGVLDPRSELPAARLVHRAAGVTIFCDRASSTMLAP